MSTTIKLSGGGLGNESMMVRCDLSQASAPVQVDYETGEGWTHTQYQCADTHHTTDGLIRIAKSIAADAVEMTDENFDCEIEDVSDLMGMAEMLRTHGDRFAGSDAKEEAQSWLDNDFNSDDADKWCEIGVWDAAVAAQLRDAGMTPAQAKTASEDLREACEDAAEEYTDGDPIYSICNADTKIEVLIEAAK